MESTPPIVVFDVETNGLDPKESDILSIGWIKVIITSNTTFEIIQHKEIFIKNNNIYNTNECLAINHITDTLRYRIGHPISSALVLFKTAISGCLVYAYNVSFDVSFVEKYNPTIFNHALQVHDIRNSFQASHDVPLICAVQKMVYSKFNSFDGFPMVRNHLHTAFDDSYVELILLLHQSFNFDVSNYIERTRQPYVPEIQVGPHEHVPLNVVLYDTPFLKHFIASHNKDEEGYLVDQILIHRPDLNDS